MKTEKKKKKYLFVQLFWLVLCCSCLARQVICFQFANTVRNVFCTTTTRKRHHDDDDKYNKILRLANTLLNNENQENHDYNDDDDNNNNDDSNNRRSFLLQSSSFSIVTSSLLSWSQQPSSANAQLIMFPLRKPLLNTYHFVRAGTNLLEQEDILSTNPLFLTNREAALSDLGQDQIQTVIQQIIDDNDNDALPTVIKHSFAASSIDSANLIKDALNIGQNRVVPEFFFMDPRAIGKWDMMSIKSTLPAIWAMDSLEAGKDGSGGRPPPNEDSTPHETLADQSVRLRQLVSALEGQYSGDTILLVFPDGTGPALLSAMMAGIPLNRVHELEFQPGEIRFNITPQSVMELWKQKQQQEQFNNDYQTTIAKGQEELKRLRSLDMNKVVSIKDEKIERERLEIEQQTLQRQQERIRQEEQQRQEQLQKQKELDMERQRKRIEQFQKIQGQINNDNGAMPNNNNNNIISDNNDNSSSMIVAAGGGIATIGTVAAIAMSSSSSSSSSDKQQDNNNNDKDSKKSSSSSSLLYPTSPPSPENNYNLNDNEIFDLDNLANYTGPLTPGGLPLEPNGRNVKIPIIRPAENPQSNIGLETLGLDPKLREEKIKQYEQQQEKEIEDEKEKEKMKSDTQKPPASLFDNNDGETILIKTSSSSLQQQEQQQNDENDDVGYIDDGEAWLQAMVELANEEEDDNDEFEDDYDYIKDSAKN